MGTAADTYHYKMENIIVLLDNGVAKLPTRANIVSVQHTIAGALLACPHVRAKSQRAPQIEELEALVKDAKPGDHLLFHYAGHGGQKKLEQAEKTEDDGYNEGRRA